MSASNETVVAELQEELLIELPYAVINPRTMMIHFHHAAFTHGAVVHARGTHYIALVTAFKFNLILLADFRHQLISHTGYRFILGLIVLREIVFLLLVLFFFFFIHFLKEHLAVALVELFRSFYGDFVDVDVELDNIRVYAVSYQPGVRETGLVVGPHGHEGYHYEEVLVVRQV